MITGSSDAFGMPTYLLLYHDTVIGILVLLHFVLVMRLTRAVVASL
jgi:hypothetical protein